MKQGGDIPDRCNLHSSPYDDAVSHVMFIRE